MHSWTQNTRLTLVSLSTLRIVTSSSGFHYVYSVCMHAESLRSCQTLRPLGCSPPGSSDHGILQARMLEWLAISSARGSAQPRGGSCISCSSCTGGQVLYQQCHLGSSFYLLVKSYCSPHLKVIYLLYLDYF